MAGIDDDFVELTEPGASQAGVDAPGPLSSWADLINFGIYNGNFRALPPDTSQNIDVASSVSGSNFIPGWRFVQSSNTTVTGKIVADGYNVSPSGYNFQFNFNSASAGDEAYIEQIVDVGGSSRQDVGAVLRGYHQSVAGVNKLVVRTQYLSRDGSIVGMPPERSVNYTSSYSWTQAAEVNNPPSKARYLRIRLCAVAVAGTPSHLIELTDVRRVDRDASGTGVSDLYQSGSNLLWAPASTLWGTTTTTRLLNYQLVPLMFSLTNIPANATTNMQLWGDTALALTTPRISIPWASSIVGCSYRLSAAPTAQNIKIVIQNSGSDVWTPFTVGVGGAVADETTQPVGTDDVSKTGGIGVNIVTPSGFTPTSADIAVVVWLAVKFDGV
jgi:hypothetical protein